MDKSFATREWLDWLTRVRLLTITLILTIGVVWPQYIPGFSTNRFFLPLIIFWMTLGILHLILLRWVPQARWHGGLQVAGDVVMISLLVYSTGLQESYFISLYLLVIIVASILFSRQIAFLTAATCFLLLVGMTVLAFAARIPRTYSSLPTPASLRTWLVMNLLGFLAVAYLASLLAHSLRKEIDFRTPSGDVRYLGISISPLRSRDSERNGYVFNFQDLTDLRRLEQEV